MAMESSWCILLLVILGVSLSEAGPTDRKDQSQFCYTRNTAAARAINAFNTDIYKQIDAPGNLFFSPIGLSMALGLAYLGARGQTATQMEEALGYRAVGISRYQVHESVRQLSEKYLKPSNDEYDLNIANGFFSRIGMEVPESYTNDLAKFYDGESQSLDFANEGEEARQAINEWASEKTNGKIENFFAEPLPSNTEAVLMNAIHFKGTWKTEFSENDTYGARFYSGDHVIGYVLMMPLSQEKFPYFHDRKNGYKYLELPYQGEDISMIIALPSERNGKLDLIITPQDLCRITSNLKLTELETISIPKFKLEYERSMIEALKSLGMTDAFENSADFSGLKEGLKISDVLQKAVIEVNEQGSEAAAVTGIIAVNEAIIIGEKFYADHPFAFSIVHKKAGVVLFTGKFESPPKPSA